MSETQIISVTEFKAKCLDILTRLDTRQLARVEVTKRGRTVAILTPPETREEAVRNLYGFMEGSVIIPPGFDLTAPVLDEPFTVESGRLHE